MLARTYIVQEYYMAVGSHTCGEVTYMSAGPHIVPEYYMAVGSHACSKVTYMSAGTHVAQNITCLLAGTLAARIHICRPARI